MPTNVKLDLKFYLLNLCRISPTIVRSNGNNIFIANLGPSCVNCGCFHNQNGSETADERLIKKIINCFVRAARYNGQIITPAIAHESCYSDLI